VKPIDLKETIKKSHRIVPSDPSFGAAIEPVQDRLWGMKRAAWAPFSGINKDPCSPCIDYNCMVKDGPHEDSIFARTGPEPNIFALWLVGDRKEY
jgi:hypothetical protein